MVFSSHLFFYYFLPAALALYYLVLLAGRGVGRQGGRPLRHLVLALLSYLFYGWANPAFMGLMLLSTVIDYGCRSEEHTSELQSR